MLPDIEVHDNVTTPSVTGTYNEKYDLLVIIVISWVGTCAHATFDNYFNLALLQKKKKKKILIFIPSLCFNFYTLVPGAYFGLRLSFQVYFSILHWELFCFLIPSIF